MSRTDIEPIPVQVVNHPEPKRFEVRGARRTAVLTAANPNAQIAGFDPLRECIYLSPAANAYVICGSISQASDQNNTTAPASVTTTPAVANQIPLAATGVAAYSNNPVGVIQTITGGTVTQIAINGTVTGLTSGTFYVPAFGTVTVTYSVAPTTYITTGIPVTSTPIPFANPNGRVVLANAPEVRAEGQNEVWLVTNVYPTAIGYEIVRKVPE